MSKLARMIIEYYQHSQLLTALFRLQCRITLSESGHPWKIDLLSGPSLPDIDARPFCRYQDQDWWFCATQFRISAWKVQASSEQATRSQPAENTVRRIQWRRPISNPGARCDKTAIQIMNGCNPERFRYTGNFMQAVTYQRNMSQSSSLWGIRNHKALTDGFRDRLPEKGRIFCGIGQDTTAARLVLSTRISFSTGQEFWGFLRLC